MGTGKEANPYGIPIRRLLLLIIEERKMGLFSRIRDSKKKIAIKSIEMRFCFHFSSFQFDVLLGTSSLRASFWE